MGIDIICSIFFTRNIIIGTFYRPFTVITLSDEHLQSSRTHMRVEILESMSDVFSPLLDSLDSSRLSSFKRDSTVWRFFIYLDTNNITNKSPPPMRTGIPTLPPNQAIELLKASVRFLPQSPPPPPG